ncbi:MAG: LD-carboxypeptidase [Acidobacteria bacterium]|nr:LD-carboxypeptidase [Acidobacteriota bacterium]
MATPASGKRIKPPALRRGDTIAIVAPASNFKAEDFEAGCRRLRQMGYNPIYGEGIFDHDLYFAGSAERRRCELQEMFLRNDVGAVMVARGGYGSNYLLEQLDVRRLPPKIFIGYSDLTTLLTYVADAARWITFHGPMVAKDFARSDGIDLSSWEAILEGRENGVMNFGQTAGLKPLAPGSAEGILYGGCLSMLVASLGTPYEIHTADTILFMEDVATKPYQIDRMLMHLKLAGKFRQVRGIVFGEMLDCLPVPDHGYTLEQVVMRVVGDLGVPVAFGLRSGHVSGLNRTLPIGIRARLNVTGSQAILETLEAAVAGSG